MNGYFLLLYKTKPKSAGAEVQSLNANIMYMLMLLSSQAHLEASAKVFSFIFINSNMQASSLVETGTQAGMVQQANTDTQALEATEAQGRQHGEIKTVFMGKASKASPREMLAAF